MLDTTAMQARVSRPDQHVGVDEGDEADEVFGDMDESKESDRLVTMMRRSETSRDQVTSLAIHVGGEAGNSATTGSADALFRRRKSSSRSRPSSLKMMKMRRRESQMMSSANSNRNSSSGHDDDEAATAATAVAAVGDSHDKGHQQEDQAGRKTRHRGKRKSAGDRSSRKRHKGQKETKKGMKGGVVSKEIKVSSTSEQSSRLHLVPCWTWPTLLLLLLPFSSLVDPLLHLSCSVPLIPNML